MAYGIPNVAGFAQSVTEAVISIGGAVLINKIFGNYWGVFDQSGFPLLLADNVERMSHNDTSKVASIPIERGAFAHYNKVQNPHATTVRLTKGSGGVLERAAFLAMIKALAGSVDLFTIITPEAIYPDCNITGYGYAREAADGARLLKVDIQFEQIRQVTAKYIKTEAQDTSGAQNPDAQNPTNGGQQQAPIEKNKSLAKKAQEAVKGFF